MKTKNSLISTDWRAKGLFRNHQGTSSARAYLILLILLLVIPAAVAALPVITSVAPAYGTVDGDTLVTITGSGFTAAQTPDVYFVPAMEKPSSSDAFPPEYLATNVTVVSDTEMTAITPAAVTWDLENGLSDSHGHQFDGAFADVVVVNSVGSAILNNGFEFIQPPVLFGVANTTGPLAGGNEVYIQGGAFDGATSVTFGGVPATIVKNWSSGLVVTAPPSTTVGTVAVTVTNLVGTVTVNSPEYAYTYEAVPTMTTLAPVYGSVGGYRETDYSNAATEYSNHQWRGLVVTGTGFNTADNLFDNYYFGSDPSTYSEWGHPYGVWLQFGPYFDGKYELIPAYVVNSTTLFAFYPEAHGDKPSIVNVKVFDGGGNATMVNEFTYYVTPSVSYVTPNTGSSYGGDTVTISGAYLLNASAVTFDGIPVPATSFTVDNILNITAVVPADPNMPVNTPFKWVDVSVTTLGGTGTGDYAFNYTVPAPSVTGISPAAGSTAGGISATISGANLSYPTKVFIGDQLATVTSNTSTSVVVTIPPSDIGSGIVPINVTTLGGQTASPSISSVNFTYSAYVPTISTISPGSGDVNGGYNITITGSNLTGAYQVWFNKTQPSPGAIVPLPKVFNDTMLSVTVPNATLFGFGLGQVNVIVWTAGGASTSQAFTYGYAPTLTASSPLNGTALGGTTVTLTGANLTGAQQVKFGLNNAASFSVVNDNTITAVSPSGIGSTKVALYVTTPYGTVSNNSVNFTYDASSSLPTGIVGVYRNGVFFLASANQNDGGSPINWFMYGITGDVPVAADWSNTGHDIVGVFRNSTGTFYLASNNSQNGGSSVTKDVFGYQGIPIAGHWKNGGVDTVGVFNNGWWYLASDNTPDATLLSDELDGYHHHGFSFGQAGDIPVVGDWLGNGVDTVGIFRNGVFYLGSENRRDGGVINAFTFGQAGDIPVVWTHDGISTVGVYRNGVFYLASENVNNGGVVNVFTFGQTGDLPITGSWS